MNRIHTIHVKRKEKSSKSFIWSQSKVNYMIHVPSFRYFMDSIC